MHTNRNIFIDILKGIAIFLMLWGHCIQYCVAGSGINFYENSVFNVIYSFHMPLFMLLSGYLFFFSFSKRDLCDLLIHRTQSMLQPIIFCSLFNYLMTTALFSIANGYVAILLEGGWIQNLSSLWFLWSILSASLVTTIVCKKTHRLWVQIILLLVLMPIVAIFPNAEENLRMYPYFILGFFFAKYKTSLSPKLIKLKYLCFPLFPLLLYLSAKNHYIHGAEHQIASFLQRFPIVVYKWIVGLIGSIFIITLFEMLYRRIIAIHKKPILIAGLSRIGEKSLQIYAFSVPFLSVYLSKFFPQILSLLKMKNIFAENILIYNYVFTPSLAVLYAAALYFIVIFFEKIKISRIMFGR